MASKEIVPSTDASSPDTTGMSDAMLEKIRGFRTSPSLDVALARAVMDAAQADINQQQSRRSPGTI